MADEPTGWELQRALETHIKQASETARQINARIDGAVTRPEFEAERRRVDERTHDIQQHLVQEAQERTRGDANQQTVIDKITANLKWVAAALLLPIALLLANIYFSTRGG
ncbi:MAG: hypothetical protein H6526_09020 [Actinobacteria bacterium]|nr:hypothetical protein [Actinomycetota bacterium]